MAVTAAASTPCSSMRAAGEGTAAARCTRRMIRLPHPRAAHPRHVAGTTKAATGFGRLAQGPRKRHRARDGLTAAGAPGRGRIRVVTEVFEDGTAENTCPRPPCPPACSWWRGRPSSSMTPGLGAIRRRAQPSGRVGDGKAPSAGSTGMVAAAGAQPAEPRRRPGLERPSPCADEQHVRPGGGLAAAPAGRPARGGRVVRRRAGACRRGLGIG